MIVEDSSGRKFKISPDSGKIILLQEKTVKEKIAEMNKKDEQRKKERIFDEFWKKKN